MAITKEKFQAFVTVRDSGLTNMFDAKTVGKLSAGILKREDVVEIIKNFSALQKKFPGVDKRK